MLLKSGADALLEGRQQDGTCAESVARLSPTLCRVDNDCSKPEKDNERRGRSCCGLRAYELLVALAITLQVARVVFGVLLVAPQIAMVFL